MEKDGRYLSCGKEGRTYINGDIDMEQMIDWVIDQSFFAAITFITNSKETVLLSPVTKVVHRDGLPAISVINIANETTNNGRSQVTSVERLCNVRRGILDNDGFAFARFVATILLLLLRNDVEDASVEFCGIDLEVEEDSFR